MPIKAEFRQFYARAWRETVRPRILARADNACEQCGKPMGETVEQQTGLGYNQYLGEIVRVMFWRRPNEILWRTHLGEIASVRDRRGIKLGAIYELRVQLGVAHINNVPGDDRDENLAAWCNWCHLNHDAPHHHDTRATRKDASRPLIEAALKWGREFEAMGRSN